MILPYLEQRAAFDAINFQVDNCNTAWPPGWSGSYLDANSTAFCTWIDGFMCPSDAVPSRSTLIWSPVGYPWGPSNYEANAGTQWYTTNATDGPFYITSRASFATILDGLSQTAAFSEHVIGPDPNDHNVSGRPDPLTGFWTRPTNTSQNQADLERWCELPDPPGAQVGAQIPDPWANAGRNMGYRHCFTPNHHACTEASDPMLHIYGVRGGGYWYRDQPSNSAGTPAE